MIDVKTVQFSVGGQIDARLPLDIKDHARRIKAGLLGGMSDKPVGDWIRPDSGCQNSWSVIQVCSTSRIRVGMRV